MALLRINKTFVRLDDIRRFYVSSDFYGKSFHVVFEDDKGDTYLGEKWNTRGEAEKDMEEYGKEIARYYSVIRPGEKLPITPKPPLQPHTIPSRLPEREDGKPLTKKQLAQLEKQHGKEGVEKMLLNAKLNGDYREHGKR